MSTIEDEQIAKALQDPTKKRKAEDEIEIDLESSIPLSKKQKRLLRRGKITLEELNAKFNIDPNSIAEYKKELEAKKNGETTAEASSEEKTKSVKDEKYGIWIGNLSFDTTKEDLIRFFTTKTKSLEDDSARITEKVILRVNMPFQNSDGKKIKNKGFCYMDFANEEQVLSAISLSESQLNGRNLLIKNAKDYQGRPDKNDLVSLSKNPPSRILFVGNLSFDTTEEVLKKHFQHCGDIIKVRMATFEDSGKCKGFAFVDFAKEEGATNALKDKSCRRLASRPIRMEYGEDRSKRQVKRREPVTKKTPEPANFDIKSAPVQRKEKKAPRNKQYLESNNRVKSSIALASAQRASAAIVPSEGKKVKFD